MKDFCMNLNVKGEELSDSSTVSTNGRQISVRYSRCVCGVAIDLKSSKALIVNQITTKRTMACYNNLADTYHAIDRSYLLWFVFDISSISLNTFVFKGYYNL